MIDTAYLDHLKRWGYVIVPAVLSPDEVAELRRVCADYYERTCDSDMPPTEFVRHEKLAKVPFSPAVVRGLRAVLGIDYTVIPEFTMMTDRFGTLHRDTGGMTGWKHTLQDDYLQVECAVYLQDNHPPYGGGLDVAPGSHRDPLRIGGFRSLPRRVARRVADGLARTVSLPSKAGDLVVFHFRILHRATPAKVSDIPPEFRKYGIFWGASRSNEHVQTYMQYVLTRTSERTYKEMVSLRYPADFPAEIVELADRFGIHVASSR